MRRCVFAGLTLILLSSTGCEAVIVDDPIGLTPLTLEDNEWEGTWVGYASGEEGTVAGSIQVVDAENGVIQVTWIASDDVSTARIYLREAAGWTFASIPYPGSLFQYGLDEQIDPADETQYVWTRIVKQDQSIFFWVPDVARFAEMVSNGRIPGTVETRESEPGPFGGTEVRLGDLELEDYEFAAADDAGAMFEWDEVGVLVRVGD
jgi:hypothetical protein